MRDPYEEHDDGWEEDMPDGDDAIYALSESVIPNVLVRDEPLTHGAADQYDDFFFDCEEGDVPLSPVSQGSRITLGCRFLSRLTPKKRERFLDNELGHRDIDPPGGVCAIPSDETDDLTLN